MRTTENCGLRIADCGLENSDDRIRPSYDPKSAIGNVIVPVVQRIEQGFLKGKTAFLQEFADVISSEQTTAFKRVE